MRFRYRLTLKESSAPEAATVWEGVVWGEEKAVAQGQGGPCALHLVFEAVEQATDLADILASQRTLVAHWAPV